MPHKSVERRLFRGGAMQPAREVGNAAQVQEQVAAIERALKLSTGGTSWNAYDRARSEANVALGRLAVWAEAGLRKDAT